MASPSQSFLGNKTKTTHPPLKYTVSVLTPWFTELMACVGSCAIVIAIAGVLSPFSRQPIDKWSWSISLNAVLSVLVTILYLLLLVPVSKCISQLKWNYYVRRQPFQDLEVFDQASRSPFGSLCFLLKDVAKAMLPRTHRTNSFDATQRMLAWLAAFLTISVTAIGPFVQQIVSQEVFPLAIGRANVSVFNDPELDGRASTVRSRNTAALIEAASAGLYAYGAQAYNVPSTCTNANCTWQPFWTFFIHSECTNLTDRLQELSSNTSAEYQDLRAGEIRYQLPNGFYVSNSNRREPGITGRPGAYNLTANFPSITYSNRGNVLANFFFLTGSYPLPADYPYYLNSAPIASGTSTSALECIYQLAGREVQAQYINGVYSETQTGRLLFNNTRDGRIFSPWRLRMATQALPPGAVDVSGEEHGDFNGEGYDDPAGAEWHPYQTHIHITDPDQGVLLSYWGLIMVGVANNLQEMLSWLDVARNDNLDFGQGRAYYGAAEAFNYVLGEDEDTTFLLQDRIDNVAKSLTRELRMRMGVMIPTTAYRHGILYIVSWGWIALPAVLVTLSFLLLALTIWDTRRKGVPKWTDSVHATIAFGADRELQQALLATGDLPSMKGFSKKQFVNIGHDMVLTAQRL